MTIEPSYVAPTAAHLGRRTCGNTWRRMLRTPAPAVVATLTAAAAAAARGAACSGSSRESQRMCGTCLTRRCCSHTPTVPSAPPALGTWTGVRSSRAQVRRPWVSEPQLHVRCCIHDCVHS
eukprot:223780-Chlamydomonas_euryale.AAC.9